MNAHGCPATRPVDGRRSAVAAWWRARTSLFRDVTVILSVKAVVLCLIWLAFFHAPAAPRMTMDPQRVEQRLLAPIPGPEATHAVP